VTNEEAKSKAKSLMEMVASEAFAMGASRNRMNDGPNFNEEAAVEDLVEHVLHLHWADE
jgi:hypothetical protein